MKMTMENEDAAADNEKDLFMDSSLTFLKNCTGEVPLENSNDRNEPSTSAILSAK